MLDIILALVLLLAGMFISMMANGGGKNGSK